MKLDTNSLAHTQWECKYRRQIIYGKIRQYIRNQLQEDYTEDQLSIKEYVDPFTGEPVKEGKLK